MSYAKSKLGTRILKESGHMYSSFSGGLNQLSADEWEKRVPVHLHVGFHHVCGVCGTVYGQETVNCVDGE